MYSSLFVTTAVASLFSVAAAQTIDPNSVALSTRDQWCQSQKSQCPLICLQTDGNTAATYANDCDPVTLDYSCVCSDGQSPNASEYSQTIPYYICTQYNLNCQTACGSDNSCAAACVQDHPCGAQSPQRVNTTATSSTMSATGSGTSATGSNVVYTGFGGSSATATAESSRNGASGGSLMALGQAYGLGAIAAGILTGFAVLF